MIKFYINNIEYAYDDKVSLNFVYNETLDSGNIIIPNVPELAIKRLDKAEFRDENGTIKEFRIGTIIKEFETYEEPFKYKYTLNLVSPTIILQSILLPNLSFSQPLFKAKYTIYDAILRLVNVYASANNNSTYQLTISEELKNATNNIIVPEMQFNRKTMFEVLNALLVNVPAVVTLNNNLELGLIRLDLKGKEINHNKIVNITQTEKLDEYCSGIEMLAENVVEGNSNTYSVKGISPRSSDYIMTTDNCQIILDKPIYTLEKVECYCDGYPKSISWGSTPTGVVEGAISFLNTPLDITKYVIENSQYITKLPYNKEINFLKNGELNENALNYKRCFLSYQQGSNVIENLSFREKNIVGWNIGQIALECVLRLGALDYAKTQLPEGKKFIAFSGDSGDNPAHLGDPRRAIFNFTYSSQSGMRFRISKTGSNLMNERILIDSQENSYVDSLALYKVEKENVSRIGNPELLIDMELDNLKEIPTYSQHFGDYYLTQSSVVIYQNKIDFQGIFTKDFIRKNLYTGIHSKARFTSIAKADEALLRKDLIILNWNLTKTDETGGTDNLFLAYLFKYLGVDNNDFKLLIGTGFKTGAFLTYNGFFELGTSRFAVGNNLLMSFQMKDNYNVGMKLSSILSAKYVMQQAKYVDTDGEAKYLKLAFKRDNRELIDIPLDEANAFPSVVTPSDYDYYCEFLINKDNREIYGADLQLQFTNNDNIYFYPEFVIQTPLILGKKKQIFWFALTNKQLNEKDEDLTKYINVIKLHPYSITEDTDNKGITRYTFADDIEANLKCFGLCTEDLKTLVACNSKDKKLYFKKGTNKLC